MPPNAKDCAILMLPDPFRFDTGNPLSIESRRQSSHFRQSAARVLSTAPPRCNEIQADAAIKFLKIMRHYLESICSDLRSHTITNVQSNDRVCLLLKDSFIDSFPNKDRTFIKLFVDTQLFAVLSDHRMSSFEHGSP